MQRAQIVPVVLLLLVAFGFLFLSVRSSTVADAGSEGLKLLPASQTQPAPDWTLPDAASGRPVSLSQQARLRPVVFSFWATWCGPCRMELPHLERVARKYRGRVAVYGVNSSDAPPAVQAFARENRLSFPMLSDLQRQAATRYGAESIPMLVVVDTHDTVRAVSVGYDPADDLEASLSKILDGLLTAAPSSPEENTMKTYPPSAALLLAAAGAAAAAPATPPSPLAMLEKAGTVQVTETISTSSPTGPLAPGAVLSVTLSRPGLVRMEQSHAGSATPDAIMVSDGKTMTEWSAARNQYRKSDAPPGGFGPAGLPALGDYPATAGVATTLNGKPALLYKTMRQTQSGALTQKLWVDPQTRLPERQSTVLGAGTTAKEVQRVVFSDWALGKPVAATAFVFSPPAGAVEFKEPALLTKGTAAPDFTVADPGGKPVKLSDYKGKVVVLDFWATWCGPCQQSLPHTNAVARSFQGKNVVFLGVNVWDTKDAFSKWLPEHKAYDAISFVIDPSPTGKDVATSLYGVSGIPTQYVIDPQGNVAQTFVGFNGPTDDLANAIKAAGAS